MSRLEWVISGLLGLVIVVALLGIVFWTMARDQTSTAQTNGAAAGLQQPAGQTAQEAYDMALNEARDWSGDVQLLSASATWPAGASFVSGKTSWGFQFYSPAAQSTALIAVDGATARRLRSGPADASVAPLNVDGWLVDSPQAVEIILNNGGQQFLQQAGPSSLTLTLNLVNQFQWQAKLVDTQTKEVLSMTVDPTSGAASAPNLPTGGS